MDQEGRRVVLTGTGMPTPVGPDAVSSREAPGKDRGRLVAVARFDASRFATRIAAELEGFDLARDLRGDPTRWERHGQRATTALAVASRAIKDAGLFGGRDIHRSRFGVYLGSSEDLRRARHRIPQRGGRISGPGRIVPVANALRAWARAMAEARTTAVVQRYLDELDGDSSAEPIVRALLDRAVRRLHMLCATLLYKSYPRLTQPPLNLQADELLGAVVERLLKALRNARPRTVRQLFALANQHMRWELNDVARRLDEQPATVDVREELVPSPVTSGSGLTPDSLRMLQAIDALPEDERETFDLVRVQGLTQSEAAEILGVTIRTVRRRLDRSVLFLTQQLDDLRPGGEPPSP
jgi:RNA polymerase sigma factor (sigma-70 family)